MRLGWNIGYWAGRPPVDVPATLHEVEELGFESVWTAEAYGSDALTPLAWWGSGTTRMRLGTAITQMSARTPTATAMAAMTLDHLTGGRFVLGLGASGPQVVEGWYGQPFPKPLARTREYISIVRSVVAREAPLTFEGEHYQLPHRGGTGLGKPLRSSIHPLRTDIPILLAAEGPKNVALAAEIADGWLPFLFSPHHEHLYTDMLEAGFSRPGARRGPDDFEVVATVPVSVCDDVEIAARPVREMLALYVGGMGAKKVNFHFEVVARMGFRTAAEQIQELYLAGKKEQAVAAVPMELVEQLALVGPVAKLRKDLAAWEASMVTTMLVQGPPETLRAVAAL
jgi:F420-dependent oxidoreductase-like protein